MSKNGMTIMGPPKINIISSLIKISEQANLSRADMSQKNWGITLSSQNDSLAKSRVCNMEYNMLNTQDIATIHTQSLGLMMLV